MLLFRFKKTVVHKQDSGPARSWSALGPAYA